MRFETSDRKEYGKQAGPPSTVAEIREVLRDADVLLIVPAFHALRYPCQAVHILQACGQEAGFRVQVLYANIVLASVIGEEAYAKICDAPGGSFAGERFFARSAFGLPPLGRRAGQMFKADWVIGPDKNWEIRPDFDCYDCTQPVTLSELRLLERYAKGYLNSLAGEICERGYRIVGCTTMFEQTNASASLLNRIKNLRKDIITIIGGANCEGEMGRGIASLPSGIDYIFSGESEVAFPKFVRAILRGSRPRTRLIHGEPCTDLDALPTPTYTEFYEQRRLFLPKSKLSPGNTQIPYETSRGCWWGQKHHCTFCGLNGEAIAFRQKSPDRVMADLRALLSAHPTCRVIATDNIMPYAYFETLLPRLAGQFPGAQIFYEQKANLSLPQVAGLRRAGITSIQPGIESLSSRLLALINKGVQARQNLMLLRYAKAAGVNLAWSLLWGFPGDEVEAYEEMLALLPLLHHLQPPNAMVHLSIDRFSPYFSRPTEFSVRNIKPLAGYYDFLPKGAAVERIAYQFTAQYRCGAHDHVDVVRKLWQEMGRWKSAWKQKEGLPNEDLRLFRRRGSYGLVDTRNIWRKKRSYSLNENEASSLVTTRPKMGSGLEAWALRRKLACLTDGWFVPLAVAEPEILLELMEKHKQSQSTSSISLQVG
jgi:ribosomal peptide maturation radical SAM protein 1